MRILTWLETYAPAIGGAEVLHAELVRSLAGRGHQVCVVTNRFDPDIPEQETFVGVPTYRISFHEAIGSRDIEQLATVRNQVAKLKRDFAPDVFHVTVWGPSLAFHLQTAAVCNAPSVVTYPTNLPPEVRGPDGVVIRTVKHARWVTACSESALAEVRSLVPEVTPRSSAILNGLAPPAVAPTDLPFDPPVVLGWGRLVEDKGLDVALRAFELVRRSVPEARMVIAGDGTQREALQRLSSSLGLDGHVEFPGWIDPGLVPDLVNKATVVVAPSRWQEPFGLVALEAAQMARPVVATRVGGLPEVVEDGRTGILVESEDVAAMARAVVDLLKSPTLAREVGVRARERALRCFGIDRYVDEYEKVFHRVVEENE